MPGIVGLITKKPREWAEPVLRMMVKTICHEPFYVTGTWTDHSLGAYVGWAVQKNSFSDGMPVTNERGDAILVFCGEDYPERGTIHGLKEHGHVFATEGSSYLVHLYEEDPSFPASLNGLFHGLLIDRTRKAALLFNDRYGVHRIYYHESNDAFYFAAEAKAILAVCPELRKIDQRSFGEFITCGCVLQNRTLFKNIEVLPAASLWVFQCGALERKGNYFRPREWEEQASLEPEDYYQELKETFSRNLPRYFNGRQKVGVSLTGGLDTRVIMAWGKASPMTLPCYTYGGMFRDCQDVRIAQQIAGICKQSHRTIAVGKDFLSRFPQYAARALYLSDGCVDVGYSTELYVSEKAREIAPVRVVGDYGSELLTRVAMFGPTVQAPGLFQPEMSSYFQQAKLTYAELRREHPVTFAAFCQSPWWHYGFLALQLTQLTVRSPFLDNDFVRAVFRGPKAQNSISDVRLRMIGDGDPILRQIPSDRGVGGHQGRTSTLARRCFHEFTFKAEYAYDYGMPQWLARVDHLFSPFHLERLFLGRHKFAHYRIWYRDFLSDYVQEILLDPRALSRPYLERSELEAVVRGHLGGVRNYTHEIHTLLTLELLHRQFLDPQ